MSLAFLCRTFMFDLAILLEALCVFIFPIPGLPWLEEADQVHAMVYARV